MFEALETTPGKIDFELLNQNNWQTVKKWCQVLTASALASTIALTDSQSDLATQFESYGLLVGEIKEMRPILHRKAEQMQRDGDFLLGEMDTKANEEDQCQYYLRILDQAEAKFMENLPILAQREEIKNGKAQQTIKEVQKKK